MFEDICERIIGWISLLVKITLAAVIEKSWNLSGFSTIGMCFLLTQSPNQMFLGGFTLLWFSDSGLFHPMSFPSPSRPWSPTISARKWRVLGKHICYLTTSAWKWLILARTVLVRPSHMAPSKYKGPWLGKCFLKTTQHWERRTYIFNRDLAIFAMDREWKIMFHVLLLSIILYIVLSLSN